MSSQNILRFYKEVLSELKGCGKKPVRLSLLMVMLLSGCAERSTNKEYQAVFNEIDDRGRLGITSIISALSDPDPDLQLLAVEGLGRFELEEHVPRIAKVLESMHWQVRNSAANALGQAVFRTDGDEVADILLEHLLVEENAEVRGSIARTLGRLSFSDQSRIQFVVDALIGMTQPDIVVVELPVVLGVVMGLESMVRRSQLDSDELSVQLIQYLEELVGFTATGVGRESEELASRVRKTAMLALSSLGNVKMQAIMRTAQDTDPGVRRTAMLALREHSGEGLALIKDGLVDPSPMVRVEAVKAYAHRAEGLDGCQLLLSKVEDENLHVSLAALNLISGKCEKGNGFETALVPLISDSSSQDLYGWHRAAHALVATAEMSSELANPLIEDFSSHRSSFARSYAARAATVTGNIGVLVSLMGDIAPNVRVDAVQGLFAVRGHDADSLLIAQLGSTDHPFLVLTIARLLENSPHSSAAIEPLMRSFVVMSQDGKQTYRDPRMALLERIGEFGGLEQVAFLERYLRDYDSEVANRVSEILSNWSGTDRSIEPQIMNRLRMPSMAEIERMENTVVILHMARGGEIPILLMPWEAPTHSYRFKNLAESGQLDGLTFHRVVSNFVIQGLSPGANEYEGYPEYTRDEIGVLTHWRGTVGTSTRGRDTGDGQVFINLVDNLNLNHDFTIFGRVLNGMEEVDLVAEGDVVTAATIEILGSDSN